MAPTACVSLPAFPLQVLLRRHPAWRGLPAAVVDEDRPLGRLLWVNEEARAHRILPGMRYAAGLSLARELRAGVVAQPEIDAEIEALAERFRSCSPHVEPSRPEPGVFWIGASGLSLLQPSLERWAQILLEEVLRAGLQGAVAVGSTRFGAYAAAKAARAGTVVFFRDPEEERRTVRDIPLDRLGIPSDLRDALHRLGIGRLGGFLDLPGNGILRRFGEEAWRLYLVARGEAPDALRPEIPEEPLERRVILDNPESDTDRLLLRIEEALSALLDRLAEADRFLSGMTLALVLDRFRDLSTHERIEQLRPAQPTRDLRQILDLLRLRLEAMELPTGVVELRLAVEGVRLAREQESLFAERPRRDRAAAERALARVRAEMGDAVVTRARPADGHLPEARFSWEPLERLPEAHPRKVVMPPLVRRILSRPAPTTPPESVPSSKDGRSKDGGSKEDPSKEDPSKDDRSTRCGPYVVEGGWWRRALRRDYFFVRRPDGRWEWLFRDGRRKRWFRQGEAG